jgi:hypothetical protein
LEDLQDPLLPAGTGVLLELFDRAGEHCVIGGARRGKADRRVRGRDQRLGGVEQLEALLLGVGNLLQCS